MRLIAKGCSCSALAGLRVGQGQSVKGQRSHSARLGIPCVLLALSCSSLPARVLYVDANSALPTPPYLDLSTAAATIQDAIDVAGAGDTVLVTNGVYRVGGRPVCGRANNRVALTTPIVVQSINGPAVTTIEGRQIPGITNADGAFRCAYLTNGSVLAGFTLDQGATRAVGSPMLTRPAPVSGANPSARSCPTAW